MTLLPKQAFNKTQLQQLRVRSAFLSDTYGRAIDGNHDGQPGGDFVGKWTLYDLNLFFSSLIREIRLIRGFTPCIARRRPTRSQPSR